MDSLIIAIADSIEEVANAYVDTGCPVRDIYSVFMSVGGEVGKRMSKKAFNERLKLKEETTCTK